MKFSICFPECILSCVSSADCFVVVAYTFVEKASDHFDNSHTVGMPPALCGLFIILVIY